LFENFNNNNANEVANIAHAIKSISGNLGARKLYELCSKIERAANNDELSSSKEQLDEFKACAMQSINHLEKY